MYATETHKGVLLSGAEIEFQTSPGRSAHEETSETEKCALAKILSPLGDIARLVLDQIRSAVTNPDEVAVKLGTPLNFICNVGRWWP